MEAAAEVPGALREHFARHNRQVLSLTAFTFVAAVLLWTVVFFIMYWVFLMAVTATEGINARLPDAFLPVFAIYAVGLCVLAWLGHKFWPDYFPHDKKKPLEIVVDFLLAVPRVTLAVWGNFSALIRLGPHEMEEAWALMRTIERKHRLSIYRLPLEIPDPELRTKIVLALQLSGLVEMHKNKEDAWLILVGEKAHLIANATVKINVGRRK